MEEQKRLHAVIVESSHPEWPAKPVPVDGAPGIEVRCAFRVTGVADRGTHVVVQITVAERDLGVPFSLNVNVRTPPEMSRPAAIAEAITAAVSHEIRESIRVDGVRVFDPHAQDEVQYALRVHF